MKHLWMRTTQAIDNELAHQVAKYGSAIQRQMSLARYLEILKEELEEAKAADDPADALREVLQVAAVAVACVQYHGIFEREEIAAQADKSGAVYVSRL